MQTLDTPMPITPVVTDAERLHRLHVLLLDAEQTMRVGAERISLALAGEFPGVPGAASYAEFLPGTPIADEGMTREMLLHDVKYWSGEVRRLRSELDRLIAERQQ